MGVGRMKRRKDEKFRRRAYSSRPRQREVQLRNLHQERSEKTEAWLDREDLPADTNDLVSLGSEDEETWGSWGA